MAALFGLPEKVLFCKKCVISNQRPNSTVEVNHLATENKSTIIFGEDGVCDACKFHEKKSKEINWEQREKQLIELCDKYRKTSGYDVVIPGSGGKDSAFVSHLLKYKYGMNPLTVTWAPHMYTEIGWKNFENWIHVGGLDNILFTPNGRLHRHLTGLAFSNLLHPFQPFIVGQRIIGPMMAERFGIKLVMYGENQAEYGNNSEENARPTMDPRFFSVVDPFSIKLGGLPIAEIMKHADFTVNDFTPYIPSQSSAVSQNEINVHYLGYYLKWDPQECFYYAAQHTGFMPNSQRTEGSYSKYSSIDDKVDPFHYFTTLIKFGLGRASYDAAQEIRNNKISREEGVELVRQYDSEFPSLYFRDFLNYIDINEKTFFETLDKFRSPHLWKLEGHDWILKHKVWAEER